MHATTINSQHISLAHWHFPTLFSRSYLTHKSRARVTYKKISILVRGEYCHLFENPILFEKSKGGSITNFQEILLKNPKGGVLPTFKKKTKTSKGGSITNFWKKILEFFFLDF
jgi:hypothetical protein